MLLELDWQSRTIIQGCWKALLLGITATYGRRITIPKAWVGNTNEWRTIRWLMKKLTWMVRLSRCAGVTTMVKALKA